MGLGYWLNGYTHLGEQIEVPDLTGKAPFEAEQMLEELGLRAMVSDSSYNKSLPRGVVLKQRPEAGAKVKSGRIVRLTINTNSAPTMALPDLAGNSSRREAEERLLGLGFQLGPTEYIDGDRDWVYAMRCDGRDVWNGERLPIGAVVTLVVGGEIERTDTADVGDSELDIIKELGLDGYVGD